MYLIGGWNKTRSISRIARGGNEVLASSRVEVGGAATDCRPYNLIVVTRLDIAARGIGQCCVRDGGYAKSDCDGAGSCVSCR